MKFKVFVAEGQSEGKKEKKVSATQEAKAGDLNLKIHLESPWVTSNFQLPGPHPRTVKSEFLEIGRSSGFFF